MIAVATGGTVRDRHARLRLVGCGAIATAGACGLMTLFVRQAPWRGVGILALVAAIAIRGAASTVPVTGGEGLTMSAFVDIALALALSPPAAATVAFVGVRPIHDQRTPADGFRSLVARSNSALATASAAVVASRSPKPNAAMAVLVIAVYFTARAILNRLEAWAADGDIDMTWPRPTVANVMVGGLVGLAGAAVAIAYLRVGAWAFPLVLFPVVLANNASNLAGSLAAVEVEQRRLVDRSVADRDRERNRIASDIHSAVLQKLAAVQVQAGNVVAALDHGQRVQAKKLAAVASDTASAAIDELREVLETLRRSGLDDDAPLLGISRFARAFGGETGLEVNIHAPALRTVDVPRPVAESMFEGIQEALINAAQHAHARTVDVSVEVDDDLLEVRVADDGVGVDEAGSHAGSHMGLALLHDKLAFLGGSVRLQNRPEGGALLVIHLPLGHR